MKNNFTLEELEKQYKEAEEKYKNIAETYAAKKKEEEDKKREALAVEKEVRKKEIEEVGEHLCSLITAYVKDYGSYSATRSYHDDDFPYLWHWCF
jgi:hypothetical protein